MSGASELVERLRIALEGVTPGPWESSDDGGYGSTNLYSSAPKRPDGYGQAGSIIAVFVGDNAEACELTPTYIALCSPDNIAALLAELARLSSAHSEAVEDARKHLAELSASRAEVVGLREALATTRDVIYHVARGRTASEGWANEALTAIDTALAGEKPVGAGVETALRQFIYETTHLSPENDDGSHDCRISKGCLDAGRLTPSLSSRRYTMGEWRDDVESAPTDRFILLFWGGATFIGYRAPRYLEWVGFGVTPRGNPTHWQPLPSPPSPATGG